MFRLTGPTQLLYAAIDFLHQRRFLFRAIVLGTVLLIGSSTVFRTFRVQARTDLTVFLRAAEAVTKGEDIYSVKNNREWNYVYFPLLAVLLVPFVKIPLSVTAGLWYLVSAAAFFGTFHMSVRLFPKPREGFLAGTAAFILCLPFFLDALTRGQLGVLIVFFCILVFYLYKENHKFWAGLFLALGFTLKFSPIAALFLYFVVKREWKVLFGGLIGGLLFLILIPSIGLGFANNIRFLQEYQTLIWHSSGDFKQEGTLWEQLVTPFSHKNQSLYAVITRLIWPSADAMDNHANMEIRLFAGLSGVAIFLYLFYTNFRKKIRLDQEDFLGYSLFPMAMLFISPVAEMHHFSVLFLVFLAAFMQLDRLEPRSHYHLILDTAVWLAGFGFVSGYLWKEFRFIGFPLWTSLALCLCLFPFLAKTSASRLALPQKT